jgi:hypothetical protein
MLKTVRPATGLLILTALAGLWLGGCKSLQRPTLFHPGPTDYQRYNAIQHDPYPDPYAGPDGGGARPRDFSTPQNDSNRYPIRRGQPAPVAPANW